MTFRMIIMIVVTVVVLGLILAYPMLKYLLGGSGQEEQRGHRFRPPWRTLRTGSRT